MKPARALLRAKGARVYTADHNQEQAIAHFEATFESLLPRRSIVLQFSYLAGDLALEETCWHPMGTGPSSFRSITIPWRDRHQTLISGLRVLSPLAPASRRPKGR